MVGLGKRDAESAISRRRVALRDRESHAIERITEHRASVLSNAVPQIPAERECVIGEHAACTQHALGSWDWEKYRVGVAVQARRV